MQVQASTDHSPVLVELENSVLYLTLNRPEDAETAAQWGLIWKCVGDDHLQEEATALAHRIAEGPTQALGMTKLLIQAASSQSLDTHLDLEREYQQRAGRSADYAEGVAAFLQKRKPEFEGQ